MAKGINGRRTDYGKVTVTIDGSGDGTQAVTFAESFVATPSILVVGHSGDAGTFTAASSSKTGFTATVATSDQVSQDIEVVWFAHELS